MSNYSNINFIFKKYTSLMVEESIIRREDEKRNPNVEIGTYIT